MKNLTQKLKNLLQVDTIFFLRLGVFLIALAGISYGFGSQKLSEQLAIYAYFALLIGVLAQIWELRFEVDPMVWIFEKIEKIGGVVFGFYVKLGLLVLVAVGFWLRDILGAQGVLIHGIFGRFLIWYNQDFFWHPLSGQGLVFLEKLGILSFYWLVVFGVTMVLVGVFRVFREFGERRPLVKLRLPVFYPKGFLVEVVLLLILGYLAFFYFPPKTYLLNEFISTKILARATAYDQGKVLVLWKIVSGFLVLGIAWLLFSSVGWKKRSYFRIKTVSLQLKTAYIGYGFTAVISLLLIGQSFQVLEATRKAVTFYPVSPLFFEIEKELPQTLEAKVAWFPPANKSGESFSDAYLSNKRSFGMADSQKKAFDYLWWQIFYGKNIDYSDLLKQEKIRFLIYQKNLGPTSLEQDLILEGLETKKFLTLFKKSNEYLIYEFKGWAESPLVARSYELDEARGFSVLFNQKPQLPIIGGVNPDLMNKKTQGFVETIEVFPGRLKQGEWWAVGSQKFGVEEVKKYFVGIDWENEGVEGLHIYVQVYGQKEGKSGELLEQYQVLGTEKLGKNFDWQRQWASFETLKGAKEVNFTFYFRPSPDNLTSWSVRNLQVMSAEEFAKLSP